VLEAAESDIEYRDGRFSVVGTDRAVSLFDLASRAKEMKQRGEIAEDLDTKQTAETPLTFPNGCHIAEVEIDPATGALALVSYTAVDDCGRPLNPMIIEGQTHGAIAQGLGQAMMEQALFDTSGGQLVTGSFMDYAMPRASDLSPVEVKSNPVPTKQNPLGVKGAGEAGCVGALPAVANAIVDALSPLGIRHIEMPATPERVWRTIQDAKNKADAA